MRVEDAVHARPRGRLQVSAVRYATRSRQPHLRTKHSADFITWQQSLAAEAAACSLRSIRMDTCRMNERPWKQLQHELVPPGLMSEHESNYSTKLLMRGSVRLAARTIRISCPLVRLSITSQETRNASIRGQGQSVVPDGMKKAKAEFNK